MAEAKSARTMKVDRPLSPHLQIYARQINMVMSIVHRITGAGLYFGTLLLAWWLVSAATGPEYFAYVGGLFNTVAGKVVLFGYTWALMHHMLGGIRHFIWDTGHGYAPATIDLLSWGTLVLSVALTLLIWLVAGQLPL